MNPRRVPVTESETTRLIHAARPGVGTLPLVFGPGWAAIDVVGDGTARWALALLVEWRAAA